MDFGMLLTFWMFCLGFILILIIKKQIKLDKKEIELDVEIKKIDTLLKTQKVSDNYTDFTNGHLYQ